jgi:hypothetical protein
MIEKQCTEMGKGCVGLISCTGLPPSNEQGGFVANFIYYSIAVANFASVSVPNSESVKFNLVAAMTLILLLRIRYER